jgi:catechol-2,3-dioxygenase
LNSIVDHIAILVEDLNISEKWYLEALGGEITHRQENYVRLKVGNTNIALLDKNFDTSKPHIGILCTKMEYLPTSGTKVSHRDGTTGVYMTDPDGNMIEFIHYNEKCNKFTK